MYSLALVSEEEARNVQRDMPIRKVTLINCMHTVHLKVFFEN